MTTAISEIKEETVVNRIASILYHLESMKYCTQESMGIKMGMSPSMAGTYLNEAVERGLIQVNNKRPKQYSLPSTRLFGEKPVNIFEKTGKTEPLTIYVDEAVCNMIKAMSILRKGTMYGGQGRMLSALIEDEFSKIPKSEHESIRKLMEHVEGAEAERQKIALPLEWTDR